MDNATPPPPPPPIYNNPPPVIVAPVPPTRPRGRGWMIFAFILLAVLFVSWLNGFIHFFHGLQLKLNATAQGPKWLEEVVVENNGAAQKIALIDVTGLISSGTISRGPDNMARYVSDQLKAANADKEVRAVILRVDSPGGEVLASDEIYRAIMDFQRDSRKPVIASMGSLAASGGYYVSAPCQWIVANELTITGSIGVIMHSYNYRGLMNKVGVRPEVFKSGRFKDMMSPDKNEDEVTPEEKKMVQDLIDETFQKFKSIVAEGRKQAERNNKGAGHPLSASWEEVADGRILSGKTALEYGFVDELGNFETAVKRAKQMVNIDKANLIRYEQPFDIGNIFRIFGKSETPALKVEVGLDMPKLQAGRLYFLSSSIFH